MMKVTNIFLVLAALLVFALGASAQDLTKEQWQQQVTSLTQQRTELTAKMKALTSDATRMQDQAAQLDADYQKCLDALNSLVGSDAAKAAAYRSEIDAADAKANELMRLSDADLLARSGEVDELAGRTKGLWENKLSLIPEFWDRLTSLNDKVKSLQSTLKNQVKLYTVGTWAKNRDCLWNISKKKDIYNNAWLWPKIWEGNRDQIKDPDVITRGQKLKIPKGNELSGEEKTAARKYYAKKAGK